MWWDKSGNKWGMDREWGICHTQQHNIKQRNKDIITFVSLLRYKCEGISIGFMDPIRSGPPGACPVSLLKNKDHVYNLIMNHKL